MNGKKSSSNRNSGYIFITTLIAVILLSISMAILTEHWQAMTKRMKEEELIFRGEQYAKAINRYFLAHKRYPFKLEELIDAKPRFLRKIYPEPFSGKQDWGLIHLSDVQSGRLLKNKMKKQINGQQASPAGIQSPTFSGSSLSAGQIVGVFSKNKDIPFRNYQKGEKYSDWQFIGIVKSGVNSGKKSLQN